MAEKKSRGRKAAPKSKSAAPSAEERPTPEVAPVADEAEAPSAPHAPEKPDSTLADAAPEMKDRGNILPKAYRDELFLRTPEARPLRMLAEYLEPLRRFRRYSVEDTIVFFGSARIRNPEDAERHLEQVRRDGGDLAAAESSLELSRYYEATRDLAHRLTLWSKGLSEGERRFVVCSGGGPGIMEAANRGASEAKGINIGLNIALPFEQHENPFITRELIFNFHYFFMRKFWFAYLAKAMVIMPGGFGTMDELFEILTLLQTKKIRKRLPLVLFGSSFWAEAVNFDALVRHGTIAAEDLELFFRTDSVDEAFGFLTEQLTAFALNEPGVSL